MLLFVTMPWLLEDWFWPDMGHTKTLTDVGTATLHETYADLTIPVINITQSSLGCGHVPVKSTYE